MSVVLVMGEQRAATGVRTRLRADRMLGRRDVTDDRRSPGCAYRYGSVLVARRRGRGRAA